LITKVSAPLESFVLTAMPLDRKLGRVLVLTEDPLLGHTFRVAISRSKDAGEAVWKDDIDAELRSLREGFDYAAAYIYVDRDWDRKRDFIIQIRKRYPLVPFVLFGIRRAFYSNLRGDDGRRFRKYFFLDLESPISSLPALIAETLAQVDWDVTKKLWDKRPRLTWDQSSDSSHTTVPGAGRPRPRVLGGRPRPGALVMTEAEWAACEHLAPMLDYLRGGDADGPPSPGVEPDHGPPERCGDRPIILFVLAACERIPDEVMHEASAGGLALLRRYSDEWPPQPGFLAAFDAYCTGATADDRPHDPNFLFARYPTVNEPHTAEWVAATAATAVAWHRSRDAIERDAPREHAVWLDHGVIRRLDLPEFAAAWEAEHRAQVALLRDIFGPLPFRPVTLDPAHRTDAALALARSMYDARDFAAMPILADALQEAGCEDPDVLTHCRGPGPHVRGCWVADLVLGYA
jgi:hypothetical protein